MRLPRVRFTVRGMMVAVAIAAAILALVERRERFRRISLGHEMEIQKLRVKDLEIYLLLTVAPGESKEHEEERLRATRPLKRFYDYHYQMIDKYDRASGRPWLPVAADSPPPPRPNREYVKSIFSRYCEYELEP